MTKNDCIRELIKELTDLHIEDDLESPFEDIFDYIQDSVNDYKFNTWDNSLDGCFEEYYCPKQVIDYLVDLLKEPSYDYLESIAELLHAVSEMSDIPDRYRLHHDAVIRNITMSDLIELRDNLLRRLERKLHE